MATKQANALAMMDEWLQKVRSTKQAADTTAGGDNSEPTTHPVMDADPQTKPATEGARSTENVGDVKEELGGQGVTGQEDASKSDGLDPVDSIGTQSQAADEVKGNVEQPKAKKDQPDESPNHPTSAPQEKYSSLHARGVELLKKLAGVKTAEEAPKADAPKVEVEVETPAAPAKPPVKKPEGAVDEKTAAERFPEDAENGYIAAALLAQQLGLVKGASSEADVVIDQQIDTLTKQAYADATTAIEYVNAYNAGLRLGELQKKAAMGEIDPAMLAGGGEGAGAPGGDVPPELMAMLAGGGEGAPAEGAPEGMPAGMPAEGAPAGGEEDLVEMLAQAGVTPEELMAVLGAGGEGGGEGAPAESAPAMSENSGSEKEEAEEPKETEEAGEKEASIRKVAEKLNRVLLRRMVTGK